MTLGATRGPIEYKAKGILGNHSLFILQLFVTGQQSSNCIVLLWRRRDGEQRQRGREAESDSAKPSTRTPQRAQRRETSDGVRESV